MAVVFSRFLLGIYIIEPIEAIELGINRLLITSTPYFLLAIMEQFAALINGLGKSIYPAVNAFIGTCLSRILWLVFIFPLLPTLEFLYLSYPISWLITIIMHYITFMHIREKLLKE